MGYRSKFAKTTVYWDINEALVHSPRRKGSVLRREMIKPGKSPLAQIQKSLEGNLTYREEFKLHEFQVPGVAESRAMSLNDL